jgi:mono/diheme cytochrome c family protein
MHRAIPIIAAGILALPVHAMSGVTAAIVDHYHAQARQESPAFKEFSAQRGKAFFFAQQNGANGANCATCHTDNVKAQGKHAKTGKLIDPLAPAAQPDRLTDPAKVEKWFKRNCNDVYQRACTAQEKGDVLAWLLSVK